MSVFDDMRKKLERERELFAQMLGIAEQQLKLARSAGDESGTEWLDEFLSLMDRRQQLMEEVDRLSGEIEARRKEMAAGGEESGSSGLSGREKQEYTALLEQIRFLIEVIRDKDVACQEIMEAKLKQIGENLVRVRTSRKANQAYRLPPGTNPAWFIDKKK